MAGGGAGAAAVTTDVSSLQDLARFQQMPTSSSLTPGVVIWGSCVLLFAAYLVYNAISSLQLGLKDPGVGRSASGSSRPRLTVVSRHRYGRVQCRGD